jgi:hypothetical protein
VKQLLCFGLEAKRLFFHISSHGNLVSKVLI